MTNVKNLIALVVVVAVVAPTTVFSADDDDDSYFRHTVSTGPSAVFPISGESERSSAVGVDYMHRFNPKWEVGVQFDFNFLKGYDGFEGYSVVPVVAYSVTERLNTFMGAGVEHSEESGENEFLGRLGAEYAVFLNKQKQLMLLPGGFVDFVGGDSFLSIVLAVGYTF